MRQVVLDTETTGLDPAQGHRVIEIGCVEIVNRKLTNKHFHCYLNPDREIDAAAIEATVAAPIGTSSNSSINGGSGCSVVVIAVAVQLLPPLPKALQF